MDTQTLLATHANLWRAATRHPFLDGIRTGALPGAALDTWLVQDYHFVGKALQFQSLVLSGAPRSDQLVLAQGLVALAEETIWFEGLSRARGLDLDAPLQPACRVYTDFLLAFSAFCTAPEPDEPGRELPIPDRAAGAYAACITTVWAVERAYLDAWLGTRPGAPAFQQFVEHWTTDGFRQYVEALEAAANRALAAASADGQRAAEHAFVQVARHEGDFWQMAFGGGQ